MCVVPNAESFRMAQPDPKFMYSCRCRDHHEEYRLAALKKPAQQTSGLFSGGFRPLMLQKWTGLFTDLRKDPARNVQADEWHAITGDVSLVHTEIGGDLHFRLMDAKNSHEVNVVIQCPHHDHACDIRKEMVRWSDVRIALSGNEEQHAFISKPLVTVTGKAYYGREYVLRGKNPNLLPQRDEKRGNIALWEIEPVMNHNLLHDHGN